MSLFAEEKKSAKRRRKKKLSLCPPLFSFDSFKTTSLLSLSPPPLFSKRQSVQHCDALALLIDRRLITSFIHERRTKTFLLFHSFFFSRSLLLSLPPKQKSKTIDAGAPFFLFIYLLFFVICARKKGGGGRGKRSERFLVGNKDKTLPKSQSLSFF